MFVLKKFFSSQIRIEKDLTLSLLKEKKYLSNQNYSQGNNFYEFHQFLLLNISFKSC